MVTSVTVSMFYIGNFADMDTNEADQDNENPNVVLGLHDNLVFVDVTEVDVNDDGAIYDDEYGTGDFLRYDTGGGSTDVALDSSSLYDADILLGDGSTLSVPVLVIQSANGDVFISEFPENPLDGLAIQSIDLVGLNTSNAAGIYQGASDMQGTTIVCFAAGTLIATPTGDVRVETLEPGDIVTTLDNGPQRVRWVRSDERPLDDAEREEKPVLVSVGALGAGRPKADMVVSPQHRILVGGGGQLGDRFEDEVFVPAKSLTQLRGIRHMNGKRRITWVHFACDRHEVVFANGCLTESLLLGPMVMRGMKHRDRMVLARIFGRMPDTKTNLNGMPARKCLTVGAVDQKLNATRKQMMHL